MLEKKLSKNGYKKIAMERIEVLLEESGKNLCDDIESSRRDIELAEAIAKRMDITLPAEIKRSYCKKCKTPYSHKTTVRLKNGISNIKCSHCGNIRRLPYRN